MDKQVLLEGLWPGYAFFGRYRSAAVVGPPAINLGFGCAPVRPVHPGSGGQHPDRRATPRGSSLLRRTKGGRPEGPTTTAAAATTVAADGFSYNLQLLSAMYRRKSVTKRGAGGLAVATK